jgi:polyisoprenoid-binding protein YceI
MKRLSVILAGLLVSGSVLAQTNWTIDKAHSNIGFTVTHAVVAETAGEFKDFEGTVASPAEDFNGADIEFTAKSASIDTENERRDSHLKSDDFFNAEKYPDIKFVGKLVKEAGKYQLKGKFTMREVTKDVAFDVIYKGTLKTAQMTKAGFKIKGVVNRFDYGLKWDRTVEAGGGLMVGQDVEINCNIELNLAK